MTARPWCSPDCQRRAGWIEDADGNITGRCPCRTAPPSPQQAKNAAMKHVATTKDAQMRAALRIIREAAQANRVISANTVRWQMEAAQVEGSVRGPAFTQAVANGWISEIAREASKDHGTHGKPVARYESHEYREQAS